MYNHGNTNKNLTLIKGRLLLFLTILSDVQVYYRYCFKIFDQDLKGLLEPDEITLELDFHLVLGWDL